MTVKTDVRRLCSVAVTSAPDNMAIRLLSVIG